jgi:hypothetical protein
MTQERQIASIQGKHNPMNLDNLQHRTTGEWTNTSDIKSASVEIMGLAE